VTPAEKLAEVLAYKARELIIINMDGVKKRPYKADFYKVFVPIVTKYLENLEEEIQAEVDCRDPSVD